MKFKIIPILSILFFFIVFAIFFKALQKTSFYTPNINFEKEIPSFSAKIFKMDIEKNSEEIFIGNQFYLINVWASWCVPCREEHNFLMKLKEQKNLKIIGLNYKDKEKNASNFLRELKNPYDQILIDENGTIAIEWGAYGVPESFFRQTATLSRADGPSVSGRVPCRQQSRKCSSSGRIPRSIRPAPSVKPASSIESVTSISFRAALSKS